MSLLGNVFSGETLTDVTSQTQTIPYLSGVYAHSSSLLSGNEFDVTFTYNGDGSDTMAYAVQSILDATSGFLGNNLNFLGAYVGDTGVEGNQPPPPNILPSSSSLWAIAVIGILVVFVLAGGPSVARRATA